MYLSLCLVVLSSESSHLCEIETYNAILFKKKTKGKMLFDLKIYKHATKKDM